MNKPEIPPGRLISILGLISASFFFVGWIYRWSYFAFFQIQITSLNLPPQSFFLIPIQVFFGDDSRTLATILGLTVTGITIYLIIWLFNLLITKIFRTITHWETEFSTSHTPRSDKKNYKYYLKKIVRSFLRFSKTKAGSQEYLHGLSEELIIAILVVLLLYWIARTQGLNDARRDASIDSTLPVVTIIYKEDRYPLGGKLDDPFAVPKIKGFSIIGDRGTFKSLLNSEETDITDPQNPRVWRLLLEKDGWFYLLHNLPAKAPKDQRPLVLAFKDGQMLILSPEPTKP